MDTIGLQSDEHRLKLSPNWTKNGQFLPFLEAKNLIIFAKIFVIFLRLRKIENSKFSEHYEKMALKSNF